MDSNCLTLMVFLKEFLEKVDFAKKHANLLNRGKQKSVCMGESFQDYS